MHACRFGRLAGPARLPSTPTSISRTSLSCSPSVSVRCPASQRRRAASNHRSVIVLQVVQCCTADQKPSVILVSLSLLSLRSNSTAEVPRLKTWTESQLILLASRAEFGKRCEQVQGPTIDEADYIRMGAMLR
jgi:hypothetical protein